MSVILLEDKVPSIKNPSLRNLISTSFAKLETKQSEALRNLTKPHVDSFNWFLNFGITWLPNTLRPVEMMTFGRRLSIKIMKAFIKRPIVEDKYRNCKTLQMYPSECRQRATSYLGQLIVDFEIIVNGSKIGSISRCLGHVPIMVMSTACNLCNLSPVKLIQHEEEEDEIGGYFVVNGNEKLLRMLIMPRRNYPLALVRPPWKARGPHFTEFGINVRSMSDYQNPSFMVLHYLSNGTCMIALFFKKQPYYIPLMLIIKALANLSDIEIYKEMSCTKEEDTYFNGCIQNMLRQVQAFNFITQKDALKYLGDKFKHLLVNAPEWCDDLEYGEILLKESCLSHLATNEEKFHFLCYMTRKLFDVALGKCMPDDVDSLQNQEVLLPGHLMQMVVTEKVEKWGSYLKKVLEKKCSSGRETMPNLSLIQSCMNRVPDITRSLVYMLATGTVDSMKGLGTMQTTGMSVIAEKLNFLRYISHFRSVHRGAAFSDTRNTGVRRLQPSCWGFLCPVHTPDGAPCGLLNHLSYLCEVVTHPSSTSSLPSLLFNSEFEMIEPGSVDVKGFDKLYPVILDGKLLGWLQHDKAVLAANYLRQQKVSGNANVPLNLEIALVPFTGKATPYSGLYLFSQSARLVRPVMNLASGTIEMIGTFEQIYMNICVVPQEAHELTTHQEITQHSMLSAVASLTPFSDHNQSPRNMYQCQMGKQTMGTASHTLQFRGDSKLYRIITPQAPLVRPHMYDHLKMDNFAFGTNAVVAVISYTGYDMEDAMILNKSSFERGFCHGCIYKTELVDLVKRHCGGANSSEDVFFGVDKNDSQVASLNLCPDGLPSVGQRLETGSPFYTFVTGASGQMTVVKYTASETAFVDQVRVLSNDTGTGNFTKISVTLRITRNPVIGDKFASRHGQKGICSRMWPAESIPFSENGIFPDIIFNPHGFPSRMTIGMMIESMAGKAAAQHGHCYDATPFTFSEDKPAVEYFGELLTKAGFNYFGTETLYSGISGLELEAEIFFGVVYYQRLRHMVSDKLQVRATGPVDQITQQPIKGRKRGGGVRFGEMERDALLAHGCAMLLHDRLVVNSDITQAYICEKCGSMLGPMMEVQAFTHFSFTVPRTRWFCKLCQTSDHLVVVDIPFIYRCLVSELAAMNIKVTMTVA